VKRDGFYHDLTNDRDVNDRNRFFVRGQLMFEPSSDLSIRLIGDYTKRDEECCAATYVNSSMNPFIGGLNEILLIGAGIAIAGSIASWLLIRSRDMVGHPAPPEAEAAPEGSGEPVPAR